MKKEGSHIAVTTRPGELRLVGAGVERSLLERLAGNVDEQLGLFAGRMREGLLAASVAIGLEVMGELVEAEVSELAGPKGKHDSGRSVYRHGSESGKVTLGGRRVPVRRPRVRTVTDGDEGEREVRLESYDTFASVDLLPRAASARGSPTRSLSPGSASPARCSKTVMSTNPMESMIEIVREHARNVKHWQRGDMRLRWAAAGMLAASTQFRRVKGYRQLPLLAAALRTTVGAETRTELAVSA